VSEFESIISRMVEVFRSCNLEHVIVGGVAAIIRGKTRTTLDIDVIIEDDSSKIEQMLQALKEKEFDVLENQVHLAFNEGNPAQIFDENSILRLDIRIANTPDTKEILETATIEEYKGIKIKVASVEQILYGKILFLGDISDIPDSELLEYNDVLDIINVYKRNASKIDMKWLEKKVQQKNLTKTLHRLMKIIKQIDQE